MIFGESAGSGSPEERLAALGLKLPPPTSTSEFTQPARRVGSLLYLGGHAAFTPDGAMVRGAVGRDLDLDEAREAARLTALGLLRSARDAMGTLDAVAGVVRVLGMVNAAPDFTAYGRVIDGCSEVFVDVFGEFGRHVRASVGVTLSHDVPVEIEAVFELHPEDRAHANKFRLEDRKPVEASRS